MFIVTRFRSTKMYYVYLSENSGFMIAEKGHSRCLTFLNDFVIDDLEVVVLS